MNKVNPFLGLTAHFSLIFLPNLSNTYEVALVANLHKTSLAKGTARSKEQQGLIMFFYPNYLSYYLTLYQEIFLIK